MGGPDEEAETAVQWRSTTYKETWRWITQVAMGLKHLGIRDGDTVAIMSRTRPAWLTADIGALSLGAVTCPIYPSSEPGQAAFVINNVKARLIFVENLQQYNKIEKVRADCPTLEHVVVIDDRGKLPPMAVSFDDIFDLSEAEPGEIRLWEEHWRTFGRDKVATIVHTSGTTGNPKGVVLTHGNILHNYEAGIQAVDFNENDLFLSFLPLSHMTERAAGQVVPLGRGCTIAYAEPAIERLPVNMVETQPTVMVAVPRLYERLYARVISTVEAGAGPEPAHLLLGARPWPPALPEPPGRQARTRPGWACRCAWPIGSSSRRSAPAPAGGSATSCPVARRCHGRSASSSTPWACSSWRGTA